MGKIIKEYWSFEQNLMLKPYQLGQVIESKNLSGNIQQIDISTLSAGNHHLRLTYKLHQTNSFTIIKTTNH